MIESTVEKYIASILSVPSKMSNNAKDLNDNFKLHDQQAERWTNESAMDASLMDQRKMSQNQASQRRYGQRDYNQRKADQLPIAIIGHPDDMLKDYDGQIIRYQIDIVARTEDEIKEYIKRINYILSKVLELKHDDNKYIGISEVTSKKIDFVSKENVWKASIMLVVNISYAGKIVMQ